MSTVAYTDTGLRTDLIERGLLGLAGRIAEQQEAEQDGRWSTPGTLAKAINPKTVQTPALDLIDQALAGLRAHSDGRLIITMAPQEGKSVRVAHDFIVWWLKQAPDTPVVAASYGQQLANRNGLAVRRTIETHPELGLQIARDNGAASDWSLTDPRTGKPTGGGLFSVGIGGGLTGRPAGLMVIDDPIKDRKEADSEVYRENVWSWWTDVASARLAPGAPVVVILTRWHKDDLAGRLLKDAAGRWTVLNIPAQADHNPDQGETDVLGRQPGEFMVSARGRTREQWEDRKRTAGTRTWQALYQGNPTSAEGSFFKRTWWQEYTQPLWIERADGSRIITGFDDLLISWDMTFKGTEGTDYVAGHVWGRRAADAFLLDRVHGRMDFVETLAAFRKLAARWPQAVLKLIEDKANGPAVIAMLGRKIGGIVPVEPDGGKEARAAAVSPLVEAGNVWLPSPELCPWVSEVIDEAADFPTAVHDDDVDAMTQALNRLILQPLIAGEELYTAADVFDDLADYGSYIPSF